MLVHFTSDFSISGTGWNMTFTANLPVDNSSGTDNTGLIVGLTVGIGVPLCCLLLLLLILIIALIIKLKYFSGARREESHLEVWLLLLAKQFCSTILNS